MVRYYNDDCTYRLPEKRLTAAWLKRVAEEEGYTLGDVTYIFCSSVVHRKMNVDFIGHDYFTDIITFDYSNLDEGFISGDIYIDYQTVADNAKIYKTTAAQEMLRIVVHGVLHLCGQGDKTPDSEAVMHQKEDKYLALFNSQFSSKK